MSRLLIIGIIVFLVVYFLKRKLQPPQKNPPKTAAAQNEKMVKCAHCGVHVPISEAISVDQQFYCSDAHTPRT